MDYYAELIRDAQEARQLGDEELELALLEKAEQLRVTEPPADPTEGMGYGERVAASAMMGLTDQVQGLGQALGLVSQDEIRERETRDAPLRARSGSGVGSFLGKTAAPVLAAMVAPGAATYAGAATIGGLLGLANPVAEGDVLTGKALSTAVGIGGGLLGQAGGNALAAGLTNRAARKAAEAAAQRVSDATKNATTRAGQGLGYVVPPTHANPTMTNRVLEGLAGKLDTQQQAAGQNQVVTDQIAKRAIGLLDDQPLSVEAVKAARKTAGQAYEAIRSRGTPFAADRQFIDDLAEISTQNGVLAREIPELASKDLDDVVTAFAKQEYSPAGMVEVLKKLRSDAKAMFRSDDPAKQAMARAYRGLSDALEGLVERNLEQSGDEALLASFRNARELIAKTHTIENALNEGSGHVIARKLAGELSRGTPLKGDLKTAAQFAQTYPRATQEVTTSMPGISPLDFYGAGGASAILGNLAPMLFPVARMAARSGLLSKPYQAAMTTPKYTAGGLEELLAGLLSSPGGKGAAAALGPLIYGQQ